MNRMPCYIVKDLLPSYADDVLSDASKKDIKNHLEECVECKKLYDEMISKDINVSTNKEEANLIRKVKNKMNKKTRNTIIVSCVICIALIAFVCIGATQAIFTIDEENIEVDVAVKSLFETETADSNEQITVISNSAENDQGSLGRMVMENEDGNTFTFFVDDEIKEKNGYVSAVTWKTKKNFKLLTGICTDRRDEEGNIIIDVTDYKTDLFSYLFAGNNSNEYSSTTTMYFGKVVEINYNGNTI